MINRMSIDKLHFNTRDFKIGKNPKLTLVRPPIDQETKIEKECGILWRDGFRFVRGKKAYYNDERINITVYPGLLHVTFNPSKLIHGNNYQIVDFSQFVESIEQVKDILAEIGISADVDMGKLSRIDICSDIEVANPCELYIPALELISPKYMPKKDPLLLKGYYLKANGVMEFCFYDKLKQLLHKGIDIKPFGITAAQNIMRAELRLKEHRKILRTLGIGIVGDLINEETFNALGENFKDILSDAFFRQETFEKVTEPFDNDLDLLRHLRVSHPNRAFDFLLIHKVLNGVNPPSIDSLTELLRAAGYSRSSISDRMKQVMRVQSLKSKAGKSQVNYSGLIYELKSKLIT